MSYKPRPHEHVEDHALLLATAQAADRFRSAVINGDTKWVYIRRNSPGRQASRELVDLLAECHRRGFLRQGEPGT